MRCIRLINIEKIVLLKNLPRTGWLLEGVPQAFAENVAEHTFEVMIISYLISRELTERRVSVDLGKIMIMSLFHDAEEALTGDIIRRVKDRISEINDLKIEMLRELGFEKEIDLLREYMSLSTLESVIVKISDLVATANQGCRYLKTGYSGVKRIILSSIDSIEKILIEKIASEEIREIINKLIKNILLCSDLNR